jgi:hypothetical protein
LQIVKAALLYGDRATIYSELLVNTAHVLPYLLSDALSRQANNLLPDAESRRRFDERWTYPLAEIRKAQEAGLLDMGLAFLVDEITDYFSSAPLTTVIANEFLKSGIILEPAFWGEFQEWYESRKDKAYNDLIFNTLLDGSTYPLIDPTLRDAVVSTIQDIKAKQSAEGSDAELPIDALDKRTISAREINLAADLLSRLPDFSTATVDEILDMRRELDGTLTDFRSHLIKLAEQVKSEPWDRAFGPEVENLVRRDLEPAIRHLEEDIKSNKFLSKLAYKSLKDPLQVGEATGLGFLVGSFGGVATAVLGAAGGAGVAALNVYREWKEKQRELERNQLYFYYEAGQRLSRRRKRPRRWRKAGRG